MAVTSGTAESTGCAGEITGTRVKHRTGINVIFMGILEDGPYDRLDASIAAVGGEFISITSRNLSVRLIILCK